tara:strand:- start:8105 stop:10450 length:2346 start_codon:yes stop_codon:yes gene_type:complete
MRIFLVSVLLFFSQLVSAHVGSSWPVGETFKSDTIDIKHYEVSLDWTGTELKGSCLIQFKAILDSVDNISLDLIRLKVDSVKDINGTIIPFSHDDSILYVPITRLRKGDSTEIKVYYHGTPFNENWGGWHRNSSYSFNLGVGFESIPHNLGKVWHPCFDNFIEKATYRVSVKTDTNVTATGSGILESEVINGAVKTTTWNLKQEIPTYLYGIAISDYVLTRDTINGVYGSMPVELYSKARDVNRLKVGFRNLDSAYTTFERRFGPYRWDKVGYSITNIGAMEHATNIAFPENSISNEKIMAHELAHHWWGDLVTCESDRDMWINEGMAVFSEYLFLEDLYGLDAMNREKESNLYQVVRHAHLNEDGYQPLSGIPRVHTYGIHSYRKGSIAAHNLRRFMGDSLFFAGLKSTLEGFKFNYMDAFEFRDKLKFETGVDLNNFFDQWIFGIGLPDYQLRSWSSKATPGLYDVEVTVLQKMAGSQILFTDMPITIRFYDANQNHWERVIRFNGQVNTYKYQFPVNVVHVELNPNYEISYATTSSRDTLYSVGAMNTANTDFNIAVNSITDTSKLRLETHWTNPSISVENMVRLGARVSKTRYWYLHGFNGGTVSLTGTTFYDGGFNKIDSGLVEYHEDSLILLHREIGGEWEIYDDYTIVVGSPTDKRGAVQINNMKLGEYVLAERDSTINESLLSNAPVPEDESQLKLYPNPAGNMINFDITRKLTNVSLHILDFSGRQVEEIQKGYLEGRFELNLKEYTNGVYLYVLNSDQGKFTGRFIKNGQD